MERDENLVRRVELRRNAANAHAVNALLGQYHPLVELMRHERYRDSAKRRLARITAILKEFSDTGDVQAAKANHPE